MVLRRRLGTASIISEELQYAASQHVGIANLSQETVRTAVLAEASRIVIRLRLDPGVVEFAIGWHEADKLMSNPALRGELYEALLLQFVASVHTAKVSQTLRIIAPYNENGE